MNLLYMLLEMRPGPERVCLGPASSVWVLDFVWEKFYNMSPENYEGTFINAGDSKTRKRLV